MLFRSIFIFFLTLFFIYIFWPILWENPFNYSKKIFLYFLNFSNSIEITFFGKEILSSNKPWYYIFVWIFITTPEIYLILFIISIFFYIYKLLSKIKNNNFIILLLIFYLIVPCILTILSKNLYNGWRHLFFILFPLIYIFCFFLHNINLFFKKILLVIILLNSIYLT